VSTSPKKKLLSPFTEAKYCIVSLNKGDCRDLDLTGSQNKVFRIILKNIGKNNKCDLSAGDIANNFNIRQATVSGAFKALTQLKLIYRISRSIYIDPHYCWRGSIEEHYRAIAEHKNIVPDYDSVIDILYQRSSPF